MTIILPKGFKIRPKKYYFKYCSDCSLKYIPTGRHQNFCGDCFDRRRSRGFNEYKKLFGIAEQLKPKSYTHTKATLTQPRNK